MNSGNVNRYLDKNKCNRFRSGERGIHENRPHLPIHLPRYVISRNSLAARLTCTGAKSCMNHIQFIVANRAQYIYEKNLFEITITLPKPYQGIEDVMKVWS